MIKKLTPVLIVDAIEPVLPLWAALGFQKTAEVPQGDRLGFVILERDGVELMYQSRESVAHDEPKIMAGGVALGASGVFIEVESLDELRFPEGTEVIVTRRTTPYGATETIVRDGAGNAIVFAQFG
jgi:hypothetical protein